MAKKPATLAELLRQYGWTPLASQPETRVWTDDYVDLLAVLKLR
jgi:hypothetical protein